MTNAQKAKAFDLIASGAVTGMTLFWERFSDMRHLSQTEGEAEVLRSMAKLAAEESAKTVFEEELGDEDPVGSIPEIAFAVSNDGGKTGVAWRENIFEAFKYLDIQNQGGSDYCVVAVRKSQNKNECKNA